jgi:hypothetical protein
LALGISALVVNGFYWLSDRANQTAPPRNQPPPAKPQTNGISGANVRGNRPDKKQAVGPAPTTVTAAASTGSASIDLPSAAIAAMETGLSSESVEIIYRFLLSRELPPGMSAQKTYVIKNDILNRLRTMDNPPASLTQTMLDLYQDLEQEAVIRSCALHHMALWYERNRMRQDSGDAPPFATQSDLQHMRAAMHESLAETDSGIAGTALLAQLYLSETFAEFDRKELRDSALSIARNPQRGSPARSAALQVCARLGTLEILPTAVDLANKGNSVALRTIALATVGDLGGKQEMEFVRTFTTSSNPRLKTAAVLALQRMAKRLGQPDSQS